MIVANESSGWEDALGGLVLVGTRALTSDERDALERTVRASRRIAVGATLWTVLYAILVIAFVTHVRELERLGLFVCIAFVPTVAAIGYGQSGARRVRWLRSDLANGNVRVFEGDVLAVEHDPAMRFLAELPRFGAPSPEPPHVRLELLASCLPLPAPGERLSPYRARPFRVALPPRVASPDETRALSIAEREELGAHAARRRRIGLEHGVAMVWGSMAIFALGRWAWHGFPRAEVAMFAGVRILVVSAIGVAAFVVLWLRRRDARALDAAAARAEVIGSRDGERLANGLAWTELGRPSEWRRR